jgi:hypothetical protein
VIYTIKLELRNVNHIAITKDEWTTCQQYSYIGVTCHYFSTDYSFKSRTLSVRHLVGNPTARNVFDCVEEILNNRKICSKVIDLLTDNASTMKSFGNLLATEPYKAGSKHNRLTHVHCNAHILNSIVKQLGKKIKLTESDDQLDKVDDEVTIDDDCAQLNENDQD